MKSITLSIAFITAIFLIFSCGTDKKGELNKLKQQQSAIDEKIKVLENQLTSDPKEQMNSKEFKFVGLTDVKSSKFDHFIRVQGKLDGDQNVGVFAEVPGTVSTKFADVGHHVAKGQVLAQIDDQQYRSQLEGLETQYKFSS
jgi:membrane fusion protein (multidrug efflux system)